MTKCAFLCVLFKTDGLFTLVEMADKQLGKETPGHKDRNAASSYTDGVLMSVALSSAGRMFQRAYIFLFIGIWSYVGIIQLQHPVEQKKPSSLYFWFDGC